MRRATGALLVALAFGLAACGGGSLRAVTTGARDTLDPMVAAVRSAAEQGQPDVARQKLDELRSRLHDLQASGALSDAAARQIDATAADVAGQLTLVSTTTTTTAPPPVTEAPRPPAKHDKKGKD